MFDPVYPWWMSAIILSLVAPYDLAKGVTMFTSCAAAQQRERDTKKAFFIRKPWLKFAVENYPALDILTHNTGVPLEFCFALFFLADLSCFNWFRIVVVSSFTLACAESTSPIFSERLEGRLGKDFFGWGTTHVHQLGRTTTCLAWAGLG